jgi:hypothetical protein
MDGWTSGVVFFSVPWLELLLASVWIQHQNPQWSAQYDALVKRWPLPPRSALRYAAAFCCGLLAAVGVMLALFGQLGTSVHNGCMACHLGQLAGVALWMVLLFEHQLLWMSLVVAVVVLNLTTAAVVLCAMSLHISAMFYVIYWLAVAVCALCTGYAAFDNNNKTSSAADGSSSTVLPTSDSDGWTTPQQ